MTKRLKKGKAYSYYSGESLGGVYFAFLVLEVHWYSSKSNIRRYHYKVQILWDKSKDNYEWKKGQIIDRLMFDNGKIKELKESEWVLDAM